jgi:hypothetical protein
MAAPEVSSDPMQGASAATEYANHRHESRQYAGWSARCADKAGNSWDAWVVDHSPGGLCLDRCPPMIVGQIINVGLVDVGAFPCRVAWVDGHRCGVQFVRARGYMSEDDVDILALGLGNR